MAQNNIEKIYELTPLQQGMLFHSLYSPDSTVYNLQSMFIVEGELDNDLFRQSWAYLIERHAVLRTGFVWERVEKPYQILNRQVDADFEYHDLGDLPLDDREQCILALVEKQRSRQFDLAKPPLGRLALIALQPGHYQVAWTFHHIIVEIRSIQILMGEFWQIYEAFRLQKSPDLPPVQPYDKYISWLKQQDHASAEVYWRDKLSDFTAPNHLPFDKSSATEVANVVSIEMQQLVLSQELNFALQDMAQKYKITMSTVVQGLWGLLLSIYCGEESIVFGSAVSGRPPDLEGAESIVGLFVNSLPIRVMAKAEDQVAAWLQAFQLDQAKMRQFEYSSLMQVKEWSGVPGGQSLFSTMAGIEKWGSHLPVGDATSTQGNLKLSDYRSREASDQPLALFGMFGTSAILSLVYDVERYDEEDIKHMLEHCSVLLEDIVANPLKPISQLTILSQQEKQQLSKWNQTSIEYPRDTPIHELFESQVEITPDASAVVYSGEALSYFELNRRANRLAHYLISTGIKSNQPVVVLMERTADLVIAQLAILKAGAAYVAIDPEYPALRLAFIIDDTHASVILTQSSLRERIKDFQSQALCLDDDGDILLDQSTQNPDIGVDARDLAYVLYTSGSTGEPKGVEVTHGGLTNLACWHCRAYQVTPQDRATHLAGLGFDATVWELWPYLSVGASVYLVPDDQRLDPSRLWGWMARQGITLSFLPTPLAEAAIQEPLPADLKLRALLTGGDRLHAGLVEKDLPFVVMNHYGPTENTVVATCAKVDLMAQEDPPIGSAIDNVQTYILDCHMRSVPVGVSGELYIGGDGLARGYLGQPELTEDKFVRDPFTGNDDDRLYRTGDLARYRTDGSIEFIGRMDHQVQLRGYRIELGEIESVLRQQQDITDVAVVAHEDGSSNKRLMAYLVVDNVEMPTEKDLRDFAARRLPEYMLPADFIMLDKLPLTANGKIDRLALPAPEDRRIRLEAEYIAPRTELEQHLAKIWTEILEIERVGIHDNFFERGGHSLMAIRVVSQIREQLKLELSLPSLFDHSTIAALAEYIETMQWINESRSSGTLESDEHRQVGEL